MAEAYDKETGKWRQYFASRKDPNTKRTTYYWDEEAYNRGKLSSFGNAARRRSQAGI